MSEWHEAGSADTDGGSTTTWKYKEQSTVQGVYTLKKTEVGPNKSNLYILKQLDGEDIGVWGTTVLDGRFEEIPIGSEVKIDYLGKEQGKSGTSYHNFKVLYREPAPTKGEPIASAKVESAPDDEIDLGDFID